MLCFLRHGGSSVGLRPDAWRRVILVISAFTVMFFSVPITAQSEAQLVHVVPTPRFGAEAVSSNLDQRSHTFLSRVDLVLVPVTVADDMDRLIVGLDKANFQVFDNKDLQVVEQLSSEDSPVSLAVVLDTSGSMASSDKLLKAQEAVLEFLQSSNPQDEVSLISVADKPELRIEFTNSIETVQSSLVSTIARGSTALLDSVYFALSQMKNAKYARRALLIISDGGDNHSRYREREVLQLVKESDVVIYSIGVYDRSFATEEERLGPQLLAGFSEVTGGRLFTMDDPNDMTDIVVKISSELRNQYVLGYRPKNLPRDGKWHQIRVKLQVPKGLPRLQVTAKKGYYAAWR
jgi:Ca-activated chloride channel family protein